jgi:hypothetical protein
MQPLREERSIYAFASTHCSAEKSVDSLGLAVTNAYGKSIFNRLVTKSGFEYKLK